MFEENTDWDGPELDSSLSEALLAKPVATPTKPRKSRNKFRPDGVPAKKRSKPQPHVDSTPAKTEATPLGKRKRTKGATAGTVKRKHVKCPVFDSLDNWNEVIINHELEDTTIENLAQFITSATEEISKENQNTNLNTKKKKDKKEGKSKKKKVKFNVDNENDGNEDILSKSMTGEAGTALSNLNLEEESSVAESVPESTTSSLQSAKDKISKLKGKFQKKMDASQFRYINERLYTSTGEDAADLFSKKPELFDVYHRGFTNQVEKWETNPVDRMIDYIQSRGDEQVVADFGCGDAKIARTVKNPVFSFDLVKSNEHVIVANSSKVPLANKSVDIAVFCLSLMGTDFKKFIREARRVIRAKGRLCVAEVTSRIDDLDAFVTGIEELGFKCVKRDITNKYFVEVIFKRTKPQENHGKFETLTLKPCTYKKR